MFTELLLLVFQTFFLLLVGHFLADFPLQGDYLAKTKDPLTNPWQIWTVSLGGHCMIHAGTVFFLTGSFFLALVQLIAHFIIDYAKCVQWLGKGTKAYLRDQLLHYAVLLFSAIAYCTM